MSDSPILIAGAGPAGLTAAMTLAGAGLSVTVAEARPMVGGRFIGGFQILENHSRPEDALSFLHAIGIDTNFWLKPAWDAVLFDHRMNGHPVKSGLPYGYFLKRGPDEGTLDRGLLLQAERMGVRVEFNRRIGPADPGQADIVATGPAAADGLARETVFRTEACDRVWVLFDQAVSPGGYAYLFVLEGWGTMGCAVTRHFKRIDEFFRACADRFDSIEKIAKENSRTAYSYMNFTLNRPPSLTLPLGGGREGWGWKGRAANQGGVAPSSPLFAGEAGGYQDYLFGLGIRRAFETGRLAARRLLGEGLIAETKRQKDRQAASLIGRFLYESSGNAGLARFALQAARKDFRKYLMAWQKPSAVRRLMLPFVRLAWGRRGPCAHRPPDHWCRRRPAVAPPPLGEIE